MTRFTSGLPGIICSTCKGCGQERYKTSGLRPEFNVANGRYEGDLFIRKCVKCDGLGAIEDATGLANQLMPIELRLNGALWGGDVLKQKGPTP